MATPVSENKRLVRRVEDMVNGQDQDALRDIFAEDLVVHFHGGSEELHGRDEYEAHMADVYEAFPDLSITITDVIAENDMVAARYTGRGTHEDEYLGVAPTGESVSLSGMRMVRIEDGEIAEVWGQRDDLGLLAQLDVVEPPGP